MRAALAGHTRGAGRGAMDSAYRGTMVGAAARQVSSVPNLPSPIPAMDTCRNPDQDLAPFGRGSTGARRLGSGGDVYRRLFFGGKKGGRAVGPTGRGKGTKIMAIADRHGLPVAVGIASASPHETRLVATTLEQRFTAAAPQRLIGDRAYDSDPLDHQLQQQGIKLIAPTSTIAASRAPRMAASCAAIAVAGKSNACLPGCITFAVW